MHTCTYTKCMHSFTLATFLKALEVSAKPFSCAESSIVTVCVCVCACVRACVRVRACVCMRACVDI